MSVRDSMAVLSVANDTLKTTEALRIALRALAWYANEKNWEEDDWGVRAVVQSPEYGEPGKKARRAIERIDKTLAPERIAPKFAAATKDKS